MSYLQQVIIEDFQSHKRTELKLDKGVNVIIGNSDSGKSAILRAINWVTTNKCSDRGFQRKKAKSVAVDLIFADGVEVSRERDTTGNTYLLFNGTKESEHKAFKQEIPEDVVKNLNWGEINSQSQLDAPFLLCESSGEVAKILNRVANLSKIDSTISYIKKRVQSNNRLMVETQKQIEECEKAIGCFSYLDRLEKDIDAYEQLQSKQKRLYGAIGELENIIEKTEMEQSDLDEINTFLETEKELKSTLKLLEDKKEIQERVDDLTKLLVLVLRDTVKVEYSIKLVSAEIPLTDALSTLQTIKELQKNITKLSDAILITERQEKTFTNMTVSIISKEKIYKELFPDICPLCNK